MLNRTLSGLRNFFIGVAIALVLISINSIIR